MPPLGFEPKIPASDRPQTQRLRSHGHWDRPIYTYQNQTPCFKVSGKFNNVLQHRLETTSALKFGSEAWVLKKREEQRLEAAQMKFLRHLLGITKLDEEKNRCIREKTGAQNTVKEIKQYQEKWQQHVQRTDTDYQNKHYNINPKGRRNIGRPRKRWRDQLHLEDQGTGNMSNPSGT